MLCSKDPAAERPESKQLLVIPCSTGREVENKYHTIFKIIIKIERNGIDLFLLSKNITRIL
jgi:hypothetical protein